MRRDKGKTIKNLKEPKQRFLIMYIQSVPKMAY
jgi:hypothetical protein